MRGVAVSEGKGEKRDERDRKSSAQLRYAYIYNSEIMMLWRCDAVCQWENCPCERAVSC